MSEIRCNLTAREVATVLHALRVLQLGCDAQACDHFADVAPLNRDEIDGLCDRINFAPKNVTASPRTITVWCLTSHVSDTDGREGLETAVYPDQHAAYAALVERWARTDEQRGVVEPLLANKQYKELSEETAPGVWDDLDSFIVRSHQMEVPA